ncbi:MAG: OsmC family protein [Calditrichaeota bacterium]|nr:OsmC family protein [Calditrichota bacterium]
MGATKTELHAVVTWRGESRFEGANPTGQGILFDSRPAGEPTSGPSPMETVLQAAGACSGMDVEFILRKRQLKLEHLEVHLTGVKRAEHPRIYESIHAAYRAKGEGITKDEMERAVNLSHTTYCSVFGMLRQIADVTWECEVITD